jgi:hypothetical protein
VAGAHLGCPGSMNLLRRPRVREIMTRPEPVSRQVAPSNSRPGWGALDHASSLVAHPARVLAGESLELAS